MAVSVQAALGIHGEVEIAPNVLEHVFGFQNVTDLNDELGENFPWADFYVKDRAGTGYVVNVKTRTKYQKPSSSGKQYRNQMFIGSNTEQLAAALTRMRAAGFGKPEPIWLALALDVDQTFDAYWGYLNEMRPTRAESGGALAIDLSDESIAIYTANRRAALNLPHQFPWLDYPMTNRDDRSWTYSAHLAWLNCNPEYAAQEADEQRDFVRYLIDQSNDAQDSHERPLPQTLARRTEFQATNVKRVPALPARRASTADVELHPTTESKPVKLKVDVHVTAPASTPVAPPVNRSGTRLSFTGFLVILVAAAILAKTGVLPGSTAPQETRTQEQSPPNVATIGENTEPVGPGSATQDASPPTPTQQTAEAQLPATTTGGEEPEKQIRDDASEPRVVLVSRHDHSFGDCKGTVVLTSDRIEFESNEHRLEFRKSELLRHKDGFETADGKKWHFKMASDDDVVTFRSWLDSLAVK